MKILNKKLFLILIIVILGISVFYWIFYKPSQNTNPPLVATTTPNNQASSTPEIKTYRNTEFGFEFQYPDGWTFHANTFVSPFSKFNLVGASPEENGHPDPISSPLLVNIVTPDFADRAAIGKQNLGAIKSIVVVGSIQGTKYEYTEEFSRISIDLPLGEYRMLLNAKKEYEIIFNQILDTFKFLSSTTASIISQNILSSTIDTFQMGYIKKIFHQADNLFITIHAIQFIYELILNGVIQNNNLENPPPFKTILFTNLISSFETKNYSWDDTAMLRAPYHFLFTNGMISNIDQQYVP